MAFRGDLPFSSPYGLYPALARRIIELSTPSLVLKQLFIDLSFTYGSSLEIAKEKGSRSIGLFETAEGAEVLFDATPYEKVTVTPKKYTIGDFITRETLEDVEPVIALTDQKIRRLARRYAYQIESSIQTVIDAGALNSGAATGTSLMFDGTEKTINGTIGQYDIVNGMAAIENLNLVPEYLLVGPTRAGDLKKLPHFSMAFAYEEPVVQTGLIGEIYGLKVLKSTVIPSNRAYIVSAGVNPSAAYEPLGYFVWKRPLEIDMEYVKNTQRFNIYLSTRFAPIVTSGANIYKITIGS